MQTPPAVVSSVSAYVIGNYSPRGAATHWDSIPRGSVLVVPGYGRFVVDDRAGPKVPRPYGIDLRCWRTRAECLQFGRRQMTVTILPPGSRVVDTTSRHGEVRQNDKQRAGAQHVASALPAPKTTVVVSVETTESKTAPAALVTTKQQGWLRAVLTGLLWGGAVGLILICVIMKWGHKR